MKLSDFDYELPEELIAQRPAARRDAARMLIVERARGAWRDSAFRELPDLLRAGDAIVLNNTRVFPARLVGRREGSGGRVELFLLEARDEKNFVWETLARPARRLQTGARIVFGEDDRTLAHRNETHLRGEVIEVLENGRRLVRFECAQDFDATLERLGRTPLPPYIKRNADEPLEKTRDVYETEHHAGSSKTISDSTETRDESLDRERYQTVYARRRGAIAAPTAGLHFTPETIEEIKSRGVRVVELTLHVGYGTFEPVRAEDLSAHAVAAERFEVTEEAAQILNETRERKGRIVAVGTTSVRALESAVDEAGAFRALTGATALTITPGYRFRAVDALLTNFHLPRSSLLLLVSAFAGRELTLAAYAHAVAAEYRFYSYGDCMLIF